MACRASQLVFASPEKKGVEKEDTEEEDVDDDKDEEQEDDVDNDEPEIEELFVDEVDSREEDDEMDIGVLLFGEALSASTEDCEGESALEAAMIGVSPFMAEDDREDEKDTSLLEVVLQTHAGAGERERKYSTHTVGTVSFFEE